MAGIIMEASPKGFAKLQATLKETFGFNRGVTISIIILSSLVIAFAVFWFIYSAPPSSITMSSGPADSVFQTNAERYRKLLASNGITLHILPSQGSLENLMRLKTRSNEVDVAFFQGGLPRGMNANGIESLGSLYSEPLMLYYIGRKKITLLSELDGKRIAVGAEGSAVRRLAVTLLGLCGIETNRNELLVDLDGEDAADALVKKKIHAVFMMGESAAFGTMRKLQRSPDIHIYSYAQADAYIRRIQYLTKLTLPMGSIDFEKNIPENDITLVGATVQLIARRDLHPAVSDLLLEAAHDIHSRPSMYRKRGEFPTPVSNDIPVSDEAMRFYKSGKGFFYRVLPFWLATLVSQLIVVVIPAAVVLIPAFQVIPALYTFSVNVRIGRWYRALLTLEQDHLENRERSPSDYLVRLDRIEHGINRSKIPISFAGQFYILRQHCALVRDRIAAESVPK
ncbi:MAG: TAXI family TRAP transporter solute-binding subunit [Spirochaetota bacterium]